jgi:hypothetical protein
MNVLIDIHASLYIKLSLNFYIITTLFFFVGLEFELRALCLQSTHSTAYFLLVILVMGPELASLQTGIVLISTSQVARISGVSHQCLGSLYLCRIFFPSTGSR